MPRGRSNSVSPRSRDRRRPIPTRPRDKRRDSSSPEIKSRESPRRPIPTRRSPPQRSRSRSPVVRRRSPIKKSRHSSRSSSSSSSSSASSSLSSSLSRGASRSSSSSGSYSSSSTSSRKIVKKPERQNNHRNLSQEKRPLKLTDKKNSPVNRRISSKEHREESPLRRVDKNTRRIDLQDRSEKTRFHNRRSASRSPNQARKISKSKTEENYSSRKKNQEKPQETTIHISNISRNVNESHLREIFGVYGSIQELELPMNMDLKLPLGYARIKYEKENDALSAKEHMDSGQIDGKTVAVEVVSSSRNREENLTKDQSPVKNSEKRTHNVDRDRKRHPSNGKSPVKSRRR